MLKFWKRKDEKRCLKCEEWAVAYERMHTQLHRRLVDSARATKSAEQTAANVNQMCGRLSKKNTELRGKIGKLERHIESLEEKMRPVATEK